MAPTFRILFAPTVAGNEHTGELFSRKRPLKGADTVDVTERIRSFLGHTIELSEILASLKRGELPTALAYAGKSGAKAWAELVSSEGYGLGKIETDLIARHAGGIIVSECGETSILDVGCGNGMKALPLLAELMKTFGTARYVAIDAFEPMIALAMANIKKTLKKVRSTGEIVNFEKGNFSQLTRIIRAETGRPNLLLFLGNTVGNCRSPDQVLTNLRESMAPEDRLLIGTELITGDNLAALTEHYKSKANNDNIFNSLHILGIKQKDGEFRISYNPTASRVEAKFVMRTEKKFFIDGQEVVLAKGQEILLMFSHKYTRESLNSLLKSNGFETVKTFSNEDGNYFLILVKPVKY